MHLHLSCDNRFVTEPSPEIVRAWISLVQAREAAVRRVQLALRKEGLPPLEWYDVLLELERGGPMRPRELQKRLLLPQYSLSRLLDRMVAAGLLVRDACEEDRRGTLMSLAAAGKALRQQIWPVYAAAINSALGDRLNTTEAKTLTELLQRLRS